jgi:hypothetical protein
LVLEGCKWDPQVGDVATLAPFPLLIGRQEWDRLAHAAERLTTETLALEAALLRRPELHAELGLSRALCGALVRSRDASVTADLRVMRFDFHPAAAGWRVSEVNSDVPGGYAESSAFTAMMAGHFPGTLPTGNPGAAVADVLAARVRLDGPVALLTAAGFMEDHQVVSYLARELIRRGIRPTLAAPGHLRVRDRRAHLESDWYVGPLSAVVRFYQAEWLPRLA